VFVSRDVIFVEHVFPFQPSRGTQCVQPLPCLFTAPHHLADLAIDSLVESLVES